MGLLRGMARTAVIAGTANAVTHRQNQRWAGEQAQQQAAAAPAPAAPTGGDMTTQLQQLAALKEQGILTEEEFAAQKAKILGS